MAGSDLYVGTLDVLILKALSLGPMHGYGIGRWIRQTTDEALTVQEGALYPALHRLQRKGWLEEEWGVTETGREAKYYRMTSGRPAPAPHRSRALAKLRPGGHRGAGRRAGLIPRPVRRFFRLSGLSADVARDVHSELRIPPRHAHAGADRSRVWGRTRPRLAALQAFGTVAAIEGECRTIAARRGARSAPGERHDRPASRSPLRLPLAREEPRLHRSSRILTLALGHRRQHRRLQHDSRRAPAPAAVPRGRAAGLSAAARPARRGAERAVLGARARRTIARGADRSKASSSITRCPSSSWARRAAPGPDRRGLRELLRRPRRDASPRSRLPRGRGPAGRRAGAGAELRLLDEPARRGPGGHRPDVRDERPDPHRDRRPPAGAAVPRRERHVHAGSSCPFRIGPDHPGAAAPPGCSPSSAGSLPVRRSRRGRPELEGIAARLRSQYPQAYPAGQGFTVAAGLTAGGDGRRARPTLLLLLGTAGFVLLIACANVANLTLARLMRRERELALRAALGADRGRLIRQLFAEGGLLALAGGILGLGLAAGAMGLLTAFAARFTPRASEISLDGSVLLFTLVVSLVTGLAFALLPALPAKVNLVAALRDGGAATSGGPHLARPLRARGGPGRGLGGAPGRRRPHAAEPHRPADGWIRGSIPSGF